LVLFRDKTRYERKSSLKKIPPYIRRPVWEISLEYCHSVWYGKTRMISLADSGKTLIICLAVSAVYRRVTDRRTDKWTNEQTDGQTSCHSIVRAIHTHRAVITLNSLALFVLCGRNVLCIISEINRDIG